MLYLQYGEMEHLHKLDRMIYELTFYYTCDITMKEKKDNLNSMIGQDQDILAQRSTSARAMQLIITSEEDLLI